MDSCVEASVAEDVPVGAGVAVGIEVEVDVGTASVADAPPQATTRARARRPATARKVSLTARLGGGGCFWVGEFIGSRLSGFLPSKKKGLHIC